MEKSSVEGVRQSPQISAEDVPPTTLLLRYMHGQVSVQGRALGPRGTMMATDVREEGEPRLGSRQGWN